jgi:dipeptidase D
MNPNHTKAVWAYFDAITQIPRPSKKEQRISQFLIDFAAKHQLAIKSDAVGNLLITKSATDRKQDSPVVALQAHLDMVCEKNNDCEHDFETDPIISYIDGDWVKARGTTLGADNGIGIAMIMAVLASNDIEHPGLECLFTVDEESGLTGAFALKPDFLTARALINLDSEDDGEVFVGCAGGMDTVAKLPYNTENVPNNYFGFSLSLSGLVGGHSGDDIHRGLGNSIILISQFLNHINQQTDLRINHIEGGNLRNAIPREAKVAGMVPYSFKETLRVQLNIFLSEIETEYALTEPKMQWELGSELDIECVIEKSISDKLLNQLASCPNGVIAMSEQMQDLVETSTNLASVKMKDDFVEIVSSQRSSVNACRQSIASEVAAHFSSIGAEVIHSDGYPGWEPDLDSPLLQVAVESYERINKTSPKVKAIHAGLECGLFKENYPDMDMISIGPTIRGAHSPDERLSISSTENTWCWLVEILQSI